MGAADVARDRLELRVSQVKMPEDAPVGTEDLLTYEALAAAARQLQAVLITGAVCKRHTKLLARRFYGQLFSVLSSQKILRSRKKNQPFKYVPRFCQRQEPCFFLVVHFVGYHGGTDLGGVGPLVDVVRHPQVVVEIVEVLELPAADLADLRPLPEERVDVDDHPVALGVLHLGEALPAELALGAAALQRR